MRLSLTFFALWVAMAYAQSTAVCTNDLATSDDCTDVINPIACYNQYRWNARTLSCIDGKDGTDWKRKACKCCTCMGAVMCNWAKSQKIC